VNNAIGDGVFMRVTKNSLVKMAYKLADAKGEVIDEVLNEDPFEVQCGAGQLVPGFERALMGLRPGESKDFVVQAADAYGEYKDSLVKNVPRSRLPDHIDVKKGMRFPMRSPEGVELVCKIIDVARDAVTADFNHPLAGRDLCVSVNILDVRNNN